MPPVTLTSSSTQLPCDQPQCQSLRPPVADHPRQRYRELSLKRSSSSDNPCELQVCLRQSSSHHVMAQVHQTAPFLHPQVANHSRRHLSMVYPKSDAPIMDMSLPPSDCCNHHSVLDSSMTEQWASPGGEVRSVNGPESTRVWLYTNPLYEIYPADKARDLQRLSEIQEKFGEFSSFPYLLPSSGPSLESSRLPIHRSSTPSVGSEEAIEAFAIASSCPSQESLLNCPIGSLTEMASCLKTSLTFSLQKINSAGDKKNVHFREPLETYFPNSPDDSEEEMDVATEVEDSTVVSFYQPGVKLMNYNCRFENGPHSFVQHQQIAMPTRARDGMDISTNYGSNCLDPSKRSIYESPRPTDVVKAQKAECTQQCMPTCAHPCSVPGNGHLHQDYNANFKFCTNENCQCSLIHREALGKEAPSQRLRTEAHQGMRLPRNLRNREPPLLPASDQRLARSHGNQRERKPED